MRNRILAVAMGLGLFSASSAFAGSLFVTGHDSDAHNNSQYIRAGLDYLVFGHAATGTDNRASKTIAFVGNHNIGTDDITAAGYSAVSFFDLDNASWTSVFAGNYSAIVIGSGADSVVGGVNGSSKLNAQAASFTTYFNNGGGIFVHTDQGLGQGFYNFLPQFGTTQNNSISTSNAFSVTPAGTLIGLTEAIVDRDITHSYYTNVDTSKFTIFETYNNVNPKPAVAFGLRDAIIVNDEGGEGTFQAVPLPSAAGAAVGLLSALSLGRRRRQA